MIEPDKPQVTIWIAKATDAHSEYELLIALPRQQWLRERHSMLRLYAHCLSSSVY